MPKGSKRQKNANKNKGGGPVTSAKALVLAEESEDQTYGVVVKALGDRHFTVSCQDNRVRLCKVRGKMKNRQFVKENDVVLICTRDFDDKTGDIIDVYSGDNVRSLKKMGVLTVTTETQIDEIKDGNVMAEDAFDFDEI